MKIYRLKDYQDFLKFREFTALRYAEHLSAIEKLKPGKNKKFYVSGFSYPAKQVVNFECDFNYSSGFPNVNWRERLVCPISQLNNRTRACIHLSDIFLNLHDGSVIYIMEQVTPLYKYLRSIYPNIIGSEFLGDKTQLGTVDKRGIRNEDATNLSFENNSIDAILSFDVFEHIPNFKKAFSECHRVLKEGGAVLFSAPFNNESERNIIRAQVNIDGSLTHILPPEYHGDPINNNRVLCYQHFGWEVLEDLRKSGFSDVFAVIFWSTEFGYLTQQIQFLAIKGS